MAARFLWGYSSVGRAPALQAGGHEFESRYLHSISSLIEGTLTTADRIKGVINVDINYTDIK